MPTLNLRFLAFVSESMVKHYTFNQFQAAMEPTKNTPTLDTNERTDTTFVVPRNAHINERIPFYKSVSVRLFLIFLLPFLACIEVVKISTQQEEKIREIYDQGRQMRTNVRTPATALSLKITDAESLILRHSINQDPGLREAFQKHWAAINADLRLLEEAIQNLGEQPKAKKIILDIRKSIQDLAILAGQNLGSSQSQNLEQITQIKHTLQNQVQRLFAEVDVIEQAMFDSANEEAVARSERNMRIIYGFLIIALAATAFITFTLVRRLNLVARRCREIAAGEGDLTQRFDMTFQDEIGTLARHFDLFLDKTYNLVSTIAQATVQSTDSAAIVQKQSKQLTQGTESLRKNAALEQLSMDRCSIAVSKLEEALKQTNERTNKAVQSVAEGEHHANETNQHIGNAFERIKSALSSTKDIEEHVAVLAQISHQTKVLSINAAIESAKAGGQAQGFYLLAEEIRKLSDTAQRLTKELTSHLVTTSQQAKEGEGLAQSAIDSLAQLLLEFRAAVHEIQSIHNGVSMQKDHVNEVAEQLRLVTTTVDGNAKAIEIVASGAKSLSQEMRNMASMMTTLSQTVHQFVLDPNSKDHGSHADQTTDQTTNEEHNDESVAA